MTEDDRLLRLEQRMAVLEELVRRVFDAPAGAGARVVPPRVERPPVQAAPTAPRPAAPAPAPATPTPPPPPRRRFDPEEWIGQRGLLAVGVIALILATGYLLKLAFDRGWISPAIRCAGGVLAGLAIGAAGWRLEGRGYRTYGAALIGCGGAITYLSAWAAGGYFSLMDPLLVLAVLALLSLSLAGLAYAIEVQALGAAAALGAFFAPIILGRDLGSPNQLLLYLAAMGLSLGAVAAARRWRLAALVVCLSYFGLAIGVGDQATPSLVVAYALLGGAGALALGLREGWLETRFVGFTGGWALLGLAAQHIGPIGLILAGAVVMSAPVWWHAWHHPLLPFGVRGPADRPAALGETLYFLATPALLGWAVALQAPDLFGREEGLAALAIALPYLFVGYTRGRAEWAFVGTSALLLAAMSQWAGFASLWAGLGLAALWAVLDHLLDRPDGRWYALIALTAVFLRLAGPLAARADTDPAFFGAWPLALWGVIAVAGALAAGLWRDTTEPGQGGPSARAVLWGAAGLLALLGVSQQLQLFFHQRELARETAMLAGGLSVSVWWLVFAAGLVALGFRRDLKAVRLAGLGVFALALGKVLLRDLASLDALYRVGSVFVLGLVSLPLAYLYHRADREAQAPSSGEQSG